MFLMSESDSELRGWGYVSDFRVHGEGEGCTV